MSTQTQVATDKFKKIFIYFRSNEITDPLTFSIDSEYYCESRAYTAIHDALQALQANQFDLAILDTSFEESRIILEFIKNKGIPFVLYHPEGRSPEIRGPKLVAFKEEDIIEGIKEGLEKIGARKRNENVEDSETKRLFLPVNVRLLLRTSPLASDTFIRLSDLKFVKLFHEGAGFDHGDAKKYQDAKKIQHLFVRREEVKNLANKMNNEFKTVLRQNPTPKLPEKPATAARASVELIHDLARLVGFTPEVQRVVKKNMDRVVAEMKTSPTLSGILEKMELNREKYISSHSLMLSQIACALSIAMDWGTETSLRKITMAALLHDMVMDDHKLCAVKDISELEKRKGEFTPQQIEDYKNHTKRAALLIQGMKEVPADVDKIVYQHHETPKGTGFPESISHVHIHPLAGILIVAHDLVDWILEHPGSVDLEAFCGFHRIKYQVGVFKKITKALEALKI